MKCTNCNKEISNVKFCPYCGKRQIIYISNPDKIEAKKAAAEEENTAGTAVPAEQDIAGKITGARQKAEASDSEEKNARSTEQPETAEEPMANDEAEEIEITFEEVGKLETAEKPEEVDEADDNQKAGKDKVPEDADEGGEYEEPEETDEGEEYDEPEDADEGEEYNESDESGEDGEEIIIPAREVSLLYDPEYAEVPSSDEEDDSTGTGAPVFSAMRLLTLLILLIFGFLVGKMYLYDSQLREYYPIFQERQATDGDDIEDAEAADAIGAAADKETETQPPHRIRICDKVVMTDTEEIDISGNDLHRFDIYTALTQMTNLKKLTMIDCGLTNEEYAYLQDSFPDTKMVWEIVLNNWTIRTDAVAFSTAKTVEDSYYMTNNDAQYLKYCTDLVALDIGHNFVSDLSFLQYMPELRVLILVDNFDITKVPNTRISDISYVKYCPKIKYLEIFSNNVSDLSVLQDLKDLEDLNISYTFADSIEYLKDFPNLRRLWMEHTNISYEDFETLQQIYPNAEIVYYGEGSIDQGWRDAPQFYTIREMFSTNTVAPEYE